MIPGLFPPFTKRPKCKAKVAGLMAQRDAVAAGKGWWRLENFQGNGEPFNDLRTKKCRVPSSVRESERNHSNPEVSCFK